jgi:hypothetical protein
MNDYPETVKKIVDDSEQREFLMEIQSHVYDAYQEAADADELERILNVLRRLGEPAEVVADRLPTAMVRSGRARSAPAYVLGGILIALFGIPLGFGGAAIIVGMLAALAGLMGALYAASVASFFAAALWLVLGLTRMYEPELWNRLLAVGVIQIDADMASVLEQVPTAVQASAMIMIACIFALLGLGLLWVAKRYRRCVTFLFSLVFEKARSLSRRARRRSEREFRMPFARTANRTS